MERVRPYRIVCIGGGTGLPIVLRGLREYVGLELPGWEMIDLDALTVIVAASDDGGSSGRLVREYDTLPPGDLRNCLLALAEETAEPVMRRFFDHRFDSGADPELAGHSAGNLLIIALVQLHGGDLRRAILDISRVLSIRGQILFPTLEPTVLCVRLADGSVVRGESQIARRTNLSPIASVCLLPRNGIHTDESWVPPTMPETLQAIAQADAIVLGPGSLYTSVIPNLLPAGVGEAIGTSRAKRIYICNIMTEPGETDDYTVTNHVAAIRHLGEFIPDVVIVNRQRIDPAYLAQYEAERTAREIASITSSLDGAVHNTRERATATEAFIESLRDHARRLSMLADELHANTRRAVQLFFDPARDHLDPSVRLYEIDGVSEVRIVEQGTPKTVIRHDPLALIRALLDVMTS